MDSCFFSQPDGARYSSQAFLDQSGLQPDQGCPNVEDKDILPKLISQLFKEGHGVRFQAPGKSMWPAVLDGDVLIVEPVEPAAVKIGDIILYLAEERLIAHRVKSIEKIEYRQHRPAKLRHAAAHTPSNSSDNPHDPPPAANLYAFILRGDASYSYDEPVYADQILGKVVALERNHRTINPYALSYRLTCRAQTWASRLKRIFA